ncbi:sucrose transport protein SUC4-like isoform X2 [Macadamia integrifolia]|uniref:sucrose transport protein SUC4-like isoform X2 n=1 Tax=Macadamia integrifolia TaxID=60698 RepID=UPI001C4E90F3|nr:sucrose transport protein SUC4-like isoform X2 [Macadamia integrifolia]
MEPCNRREMTRPEIQVRHSNRPRVRPPTRAPPPARSKVPLKWLFRVASVAGGIQFGWALQLSLLTPYVQELGIPHAWASWVWLCGPLSGLLVQPLVGHMSDHCKSRFGRRRPFIVAGSISIVIAVLIIGHAADIGRLLGDSMVSRPRAIVVFVLGFWLLDVANNVIQGPCRALLADLTGKDQRRTRIANAYYSLFMAVGNVLGYATGSYSGWYLTRPIWIILIVTALTWIGWFPFLLFDTDWMGREIYRGKPNEGKNYHMGVRMGSFGLMLNSVVLGLTSVVMEKLCKKWGAGLVWGISNILMSLCFITMLIISHLAANIEYTRDDLPPEGIVIAALVVFTVLGAPLAVTYSVPYAMIATRIESLGLGQGLSMGILNIAIVIPQVLVSVGSGPLDQLFGGGNSPSFAVAAVAVFASGLIAILALPRLYVQKHSVLV